MADQATANIIFFDPDTQQLKLCSVAQSRVQSAIDRALVLPFPLDAPEDSTAPITDEDARKLGGMLLLMQAAAHPELRDRLQITTESPMNWAPAERPKPL